MIADELNAMADAGLSLKMVGIRVTPGHRIEAADVVALDRQAIRFQPIASQST